MKTQPLIFEVSRPGRTAFSLPECDVPVASDAAIPSHLRGETPPLPEVSEVELIRHFTQLSMMNHGVDAGFYPLGSCTMKYNPKLNEDMAQLEGFAQAHPYQSAQTAQGCLQLLYEMDTMLSEITGMARVSMQPAAGAHGELTGLMIMKAYHEHRRDAKRTKIVVPDSAHGTNPASAAAAGFDVIEVKSNARGLVDAAALEALMSDEIAGLMLTNPNTLGLFEEDIRQIADIVHRAGGLLYYDGANANAILGVSRPGDMGFDVVHINLHKTFATPHGGGGPGAGPVGVKPHLVPFLPKPVIEKVEDRYVLDDERPLSIGRVRSFYGNFGVVVKAYAYIRTMGPDGLRQVSEAAVLNANYIREQLKADYALPYDRACMHEVVFSGQRQKEEGVSTLDIAKRLIDFGVHPPTIYFPMIVSETLMIEPTETESRETLDEFIAAMKQIAMEAKQTPDILREAPHGTPVSRLDEAKAARDMKLKYKPE